MGSSVKWETGRPRGIECRKTQKNQDVRKESLACVNQAKYMFGR